MTNNVATMKEIIAAIKKGEWKNLDDGRVEVGGVILEPDEFSFVLVPKDPKSTKVFSTRRNREIYDEVCRSRPKTEGEIR